MLHFSTLAQLLCQDSNQDTTLHLVARLLSASRWWQSLRLSLFVMTLTVLRRAGGQVIFTWPATGVCLIYFPHNLTEVTEFWEKRPRNVTSSPGHPLTRTHGCDSWCWSPAEVCARFCFLFSSPSFFPFLSSPSHFSTCFLSLLLALLAPCPTPWFNHFSKKHWFPSNY